MTRKKKLFLNTVTGLTKQIVMVVCGFILPRYMLLYYGSSVNGLVSSITNFLGFISLLDLGVGAVIQANLYLPLAKKNNVQISRIVRSSERFFRRLAYIFVVYIIILCFVFPLFVNKTFDFWFTVSLIIIISISTLFQYLFGISYQLLLNADQRSYVQLTIQIVTILLNTGFAILLMRVGAGVHYVKLASALVFILQPLCYSFYVHKHYEIDKKIEVVGEPIKQKWNGFSQHVASVICQNIAVTVLTFFSTLINVSIYSVYYNVTNGVTQIIMTASTGLESLFGNMIANQEKDKLLKTFSVVEWCFHNIVTAFFTIAAITIVPFVSIYTRGITDANYIYPLFGALLLTAYAVQCLRIPYFRIIKAAGHFKETQNGAYISALLNILITVPMVIQYGLIGAPSGIFIAMIYHTCYFVWYLQHNILNRSPKHFIGYVFSDMLIASITYFLTKGIVLDTIAYPSWIIMVIKISIITFAVVILINFALYRSHLKLLLQLIRCKKYGAT